jgi:hypothetical protein
VGCTHAHKSQDSDNCMQSWHLGGVVSLRESFFGSSLRVIVGFFSSAGRLCGVRLTFDFFLNFFDTVLDRSLPIYGTDLGRDYGIV